MERKRLLIISGSSDVCGQELELIRAHAEMLRMEVVQESVQEQSDLSRALRRNSDFDYFYLCTHGNRECFSIGNSSMTWSNFAELVCTSGCLREGATFLLACCRGGLNRVAYDIFIGCPMIDYVCGPSAIALPTDLTTGFVVFLTRLEAKGADPVYAAKAASQASEREFICFDRNVIEGQSDYHLRLEELSNNWAPFEGVKSEAA